MLLHLSFPLYIFAILSERTELPDVSKNMDWCADKSIGIFIIFKQKTYFNLPIEQLFCSMNLADKYKQQYNINIFTLSQHFSAFLLKNIIVIILFSIFMLRITGQRQVNFQFIFYYSLEYKRSLMEKQEKIFFKRPSRNEQTIRKL